MTGQVIQRDQLGPLTKIGQGGQGVVYQTPNIKTKFAESMVYKQYKANLQVDFAALAAMPTLVEESLSYHDAERLVSIAAWPCALVEDNGTPTGFVMPTIPDEFNTPLTTVKSVEPGLAEFQYLLNDPSIVQRLGITIDDVQRYTLLREVASALVFLHKHSVCVGDISPRNLLFSLSPTEGVYFVDCDAMRINGVSALPHVETPGWEVPNGEEPSTIQSDTYKLGLLALRLLAGDQDIRDPNRLPSTTPQLLRQLITDSLSPEPDRRPLPSAWTYILGRAIEEAEHQKLTTQPAPPPSARPAPPQPVVRSRPRPAAVEAPPPPPPTAPTSSNTKIWAAAAVAVAVVIGVVVLTVKLTAGSNGESSSSSPETESTVTETSTYPEQSSTSSTTTTTVSFSAPPALYQDPDNYDGDLSCVNGKPLPAHPGGRAGRGSDKTSCQFAFNVGQAYWSGWGGNSDPRYPRRITAPGAVPCSSVQARVPGVQCGSNDEFVMNCAVEGADEWITCRGGDQAVVYIF
jgi:serine/threonine protein kinase